MVEIITTDELAERLAVSSGTIARWARERRIPELRPTQRTRRFDFAEVMNAMRMARAGGIADGEASNAK